MQRKHHPAGGSSRFAGPTRPGVLFPGLVLTLFTAAIGLACGSTSGGGEEEPPPPGSFQVNWRITALSLSCEEAGLESVELQLRLDGSLAFDERRPCGDLAATIDDIAPGRYELALVGVDAANKPTYRSETTAVTIEPASTTMVGTIRLEQVPATLQITWSFANTRLCGFNQVRTVEIVVFDVDLQKHVFPRTSFDCNRADPVQAEVRPGTVKVIASGIDATGAPIFAADQQFTVVAGQPKDVHLLLQKCGEGAGDQPGC